MMVSSFARCLALIAAVSVTLIGSSVLHAQEAVLPDPLRVALSHYAEMDPLAVNWTEICTVPEKQDKVFSNNDFLLAFRDSRMYMLRQPKDKRKLSTEIAFDRSVFYMGDSEKAVEHAAGNKPGIIKWLPGKNHPKSRYFSQNYFRAAGIRLPRNVGELMLSWCPQSELLALLAEGGRIEATSLTELEGRKLLRVQVKAQDLSHDTPPVDIENLEKNLRGTQSFTKIREEDIQKRLAASREASKAQPPRRRFDFYFDSERGYAVRRLDILDETGRLLTRFDCTEHEQVNGRNVWLPRRCRMEEYTVSRIKDQVFASPYFVTQFKVRAFDLKPWPYERFELKYTTPGTHIGDKTFPEVNGDEGVTYKIPANPQQLDEVIAAAREKYAMQASAEERSRRLKTLFLVINGVGLAAYVVCLIIRWRKRATSA